MNRIDEINQEIVKLQQERAEIERHYEIIATQEGDFVHVCNGNRNYWGRVLDKDFDDTNTYFFRVETVNQEECEETVSENDIIQFVHLGE